MVAIFTKKGAFAAGLFGIIAYMGYKEDVFKSKDEKANKKYFEDAEAAAKAAVEAADAKRKAKSGGK